MVPKNNRRERLHITLPEDVYRALEIKRAQEGMHRSEAVTEALRKYVAAKDAEDMDRRGRISEKIETSQDHLEELVRGQAERIAKMVYRAHVSGEALLMHVAEDDESRARMKKAASRVIGEESNGERRRTGGEGRR